MHRQRLKTLAAHLEQLRKPLNMEAWFSDCGTAACAVGHACSLPEFQQEGLYAGCSQITRRGLVPSFDSEQGWDAVQLFFHLTYSQAKWLFGESAYESESDEEGMIEPSAVATRISSLIEKDSF